MPQLIVPVSSPDWEREWGWSLNWDGEIYTSGSGKAASKQGSPPLHSKKDSYGNACPLPPACPLCHNIPFQRTPFANFGGPGGGAGPGLPTPPAPKLSSLAELGPSCVLLLPLRPYPGPPQTPCLLLTFVGVRRETLKSGTFCGLSVTSKKRQWAKQLPSERRK